MNCRCGIPAKRAKFNGGESVYYCGYHPSRCKIKAKGPIVPIRLENPTADPCRHVSLELGLHPKTKSDIVYVRPINPDDRILRAIFESDNSSFPNAEYNMLTSQWLLPLSDYDALLIAIRNIKPPIPFEAVPPYVFECKNRIDRRFGHISSYPSDSVLTNKCDLLTSSLYSVPADGVSRTILTSSEEDQLKETYSSLLYDKLRNFQKQGVQFVLDHNGRTMIADEMGLGKTVQAICAAHHYRDKWPVLVVCPGSLCENWKKEFNKWLRIPNSMIAVITCNSTRNKRSQKNITDTCENLEIAQVVIVSYQNIRLVSGALENTGGIANQNQPDVLFNNVFKVAILDESHNIKSCTAARTKSTLALCSKAEHVILLSGTPALNRPIELYPQIMLIDPKGFMNKQMFEARYCGGFISNYGFSHDVSGFGNTNELNMLLKHYVIRRSKQEVMSDLPTKQRRILYLRVTKKERDLMQKSIADLGRKMQSSLVSKGSLNINGISQSDILEMKSKTSRVKAPAVQEYLTDIIEQLVEENITTLMIAREKSDLLASTEKIIVFAHHMVMVDAIELVCKTTLLKKGFDYIKITGEVPQSERERLCDHFRSNNNCCVAVLTMQTMGTGHNLTCASRVYFTELDWTPSLHLQCEDRVHRIGQKNDCSITYLLADGTSDEVIWPMLQQKLDVTHAVLSNSVQQAVILGSGSEDKETVGRKVMDGQHSNNKDASDNVCTLDSWLCINKTELTDNISTSLSVSPTHGGDKKLAIKVHQVGDYDLATFGNLIPAVCRKPALYHLNNLVDVNHSGGSTREVDNFPRTAIPISSNDISTRTLKPNSPFSPPVHKALDVPNTSSNILESQSNILVTSKSKKTILGLPIGVKCSTSSVPHSEQPTTVSPHPKKTILGAPLITVTNTSDSLSPVPLMAVGQIPTEPISLSRQRQDSEGYTASKSPHNPFLVRKSSSPCPVEENVAPFHYVNTSTATPKTTDERHSIRQDTIGCIDPPKRKVTLLGLPPRLSSESTCISSCKMVGDCQSVEGLPSLVGPSTTLNPQCVNVVSVTGKRSRSM